MAEIMTRTPYSPELAEVLKDYLEKNGMRFIFDEKNGEFFFRLGGSVEMEYMCLTIGLQEDSYTVYGKMLVDASAYGPDALARAAEFVCRVNFSMTEGCFLLDHIMGEVGFRYHVDCADHPPTERAFVNAVCMTSLMIQGYFYGVLMTILGKTSVIDAIEACEQAMDLSMAEGETAEKLQNSKLMLHEPLLGNQISGSATSIQSISDALLQTRKQMNQLLARHTGKTEEEIAEACGYDHYFSAEESVQFGLCDGIMEFGEMLRGDAL